MSRRGGIFDLIFAIVAAVTIVTFMVLMTYVGRVTNEQFINFTPTLQKNLVAKNATTIISNTIGKTYSSFSTFKWLSTFLIFGFFLCTLLGAFLVRTHPAWFVAYLFILVMAIIFSVGISNMYAEVRANPLLANDFAGFYSTNWIFDYLPIWVTIFGLAAAVLMYANLQSMGDYY